MTRGMVARTQGLEEERIPPGKRQDRPEMDYRKEIERDE